MGELRLGLDVGTTSCKAVVLDADGAEVGQGHLRTPWTRVRTGAEIDPDALVRAALAAAAEALASGPAGTVTGVGIAGMAETGVLIGRDGRPVGPAIAWHDTRGSEAATELAAAFGARGFAGRTGLPPSALCSLSKLAWQRSHLPAAAGAARWLGVPEWVARALGAGEAAELSLASRTGLLELRERAWWPDALAWLGVRDGFLPEPVPAGVPVGHVGEAFPPARGAAVAIAGHDHLAAMVGAGADRDGDVLLSSGTAEVAVRTLAAGLPADRIADAVGAGVTVGLHVLAGRWALLSGGELEVAPTSALSDASPADAWEAALEAGAEANAARLAASDAVAGAHGRIVAAGGGTRSDAARAAKARRLGVIEWSPVREATARGAALLAGRSAPLAEAPAGRPG